MDNHINMKPEESIHSIFNKLMQVEDATQQWRQQLEIHGKRSVSTSTYYGTNWQRIFIKIKKYSIHQPCEELSDIWQWDLAMEETAWGQAR